jgi:hypothetical protein
MTSRFLIGAATLAAVSLAIGGTALAQRGGERLEMLRQHLQQIRALPPADPNMTPIRAPGDYRFSVVEGGLTRDYLVHVPKS